VETTSLSSMVLILVPPTTRIEFRSVRVLYDVI
jgi:hypothetical protein